MIVTHDAFRGITGAFDSSIPLLEEARRLGLSTQINISIGITTSSNCRRWQQSDGTP